MQIALPSPFDFRETLRFLNRSQDECLHYVSRQQVIKLLEEGNNRGLVSIHVSADQLIVTQIKGDSLSSDFIRHYLNQWFDLDRDLSSFYAIEDENIKSLIKAFPGVRVVAIPDLFEAICWSIIGQQINLAFAYKIKRRLIEHFDESIEYEGHKHYLFPDPEHILTLSEKELRDMQFSRQKIQYIQIAAEKLASGEVSRKTLEPLTYESRLGLLTSIKGIGEWSANYILMKTLRQQEAIPYGDAGLNQGISRILGLDRKPTRSETEDFFKKAPGWGAYLTFYVWRSLGE